MISSKDLMERAGISRATLNNYIALGLLSKPELRSSDPAGSPDMSGARVLGYFPDDAVERLARIRELKASGWSMSQIAASMASAAAAPTLGAGGHVNLPATRSGSQAHAASGAAVPVPTVPAASPAVAIARGAVPAATGQALSGADAPLQLTLDDVRQPAYMLNHSLELTWFNEAARSELLGNFERLPAGHAERNVLPMIAALPERAGAVRRDELLRAHVQLARARLSRADLLATLRGQSPELLQQVAQIYDECPGAPQPLRDLPAAAAIPFERVRADGSVSRCQLVTSSFREGTLIICVDDDGLDETLLQFLARRDLMIRQLLRKRLPVFTPLAVLVADLQGSTRICSELPPEEYFELINEMRTAMDPIFRAHGATHGKHVGDGMLYFFFPQPDSHYVFNALRCAHEIREEMRRLSQRWALRKGWFNELLLNMAVHEGTEWLGTFQTATSVEFAVLGDTINQAARLGEFARHGTVWATKSLIGKLSADERARVQFGVSRRHPDGREVFVERTFAQIGTLAAADAGGKLGDVAQMAVAEVRSVQAPGQGA